MRIEVRVSGGVTGVRRPPAVVDTSELEPDAAAELEALAARVDLSASEAGPAGPDRLQFDVVVDGPQGRRAGRLHEGRLAPEAEALIRAVRRKARAEARRPR